MLLCKNGRKASVGNRISTYDRYAYFMFRTPITTTATEYSNQHGNLIKIKIQNKLFTKILPHEVITMWIAVAR